MPIAFAAKKACVFGLGKSGAAAVRLLVSEGISVVAVDERSEQEVADDIRALSKEGAELRFGPQVGPTLEGAELIVVSPGVPLGRPELVKARARGAQVIGEVELASRFIRGDGPILGVTGTNGKSTTTALLGELFQQAKKKVFVGGNLGRPFSESPLSKETYEAHILELSSFQLEGIEAMRINGAALLNITPDHLDRYASHHDYGKAKARIFMNQKEGDFAVVNADDPFALELAVRCGVLHGFSLKPRSKTDKRFTAFASPHEEGFLLEAPQGSDRFTVSNRALRGAHNLMNAMAAALLAQGAGLSTQDIQRGLDAYPGLPHRLEYVRFVRGVEWVNDSKATNVDSALVALRSFSEKVWLIAGGKGKGAPYAPLVAESAGRVKGVLTIGQDAPLLEEAYRGKVAVEGCGTLEAAVSRAHALAQEGDVVLLSPACASYDQFKNFEDRGDCFKRLVRALT